MSLSYLGSTIEEKTRAILGWTDANRPSIVVTNGKGSAGNNWKERKECRRRNNAPYYIRRQDLSLTPPISPATITSSSLSALRKTSSSSAEESPLSPVSPNTPFPAALKRPNRDEQVFERLRQLVPVLPADTNAYRILIETISSVIDLEHHLDQLSEQADGIRTIVMNQSSASQTITTEGQQMFPADLATVDVTAFKSLLNSPSSTSLFGQPLTVDTTFAVA